MTAKELIVGSALLVGAAFTAAVGMSSATLAQGYYGYHRHWYGPSFGGLYDYYGGYGVNPPSILRGGPGPRVQAGGGMGIGAVR